MSAMVDSDGVEELLDESARAAVMVASQVAEPLRRMVADERREAQARAEERARDLEQRVAAERAAARAELAVVAHEDWWDKATQQDIARAWTVATAWAPLDKDAAAAAQTIRTQAQTRYGVDLEVAAPVDSSTARAERADLRDPYRRGARRSDVPAREDTSVSPVHVEQAAGFAGAAVDADRARRASRADELTAVAILTDHDPTGDAAGVALYDSAERRSELADRLERAGVDVEIVEARLVADKGFAAAPAAAVAASPRAKSMRGPGPQVRQDL
ncbi:hypothetical protein [Cellulomonas cellasea]|uniref:Uncharacterized protein n=1 Tax=Cellulomonas cellasea TaxID=43670 RepID=A0A4Y3KYA1_9CELL|nr:hypothetical protein [Cellulomonas cellasea]GEA89073.1 hypothetical protein CCE01nite_30220 [Cellulomonas cellasea]